MEEPARPGDAQTGTLSAVDLLLSAHMHVCCRYQEAVAQVLESVRSVTRNCGIDVFDAVLALPAHMYVCSR